MLFLFKRLVFDVNAPCNFIYSVVEEQVATPSNNQWKVYAGIALVLVVVIGVVIICSSGSSPLNPGDSLDPGS